MTDYTENFTEIEINADVTAVMKPHPSYNKNDNIFIGKTVKNDVFVYPKNKLEPIFPMKILSYNSSSEKFYFFIRRFYKLRRNQDRVYVIMYSNDRSTGDIKRFEYYRSTSDGYFWRLCIKRDDDESFDKGFNYISSTFVNMNIQHFISKQISSYNIDNLDESIQCIKKTNLEGLDYNLYKRIFNQDSVSQNVFFKSLNEIFPSVDYLLNYKNCIYTLLNKLANLINNNKPNTGLEIDFLSNLFSKLHQFQIHKDINLTEESSRSTFFKKLKNVFTLLFLEYFKIVDSSVKFIMDQKFNIGHIEFEAKVYKVHIYSVNFGGNYILYYIIYKNEQISRSLQNHPDKIYKNILYITPHNNSINFYGLDKRYIAAGAFINKIFDYEEQSPITKTTSDLKTGHITLDGYTFIGDLTDYDFLPIKEKK